ncbi:MAG: dihydrofolate reductase [Cyanobacteria bacterium]|nr:dihydrofolate reductase [Cyanobacteriota bacterium]MDW8203168.1 dihydrofolate reductase [Cyanobacteriota bacterium SKYGB_h_bin112]
MKMPEIVIIAALAERNRVIGRHGKVPWHIPEDSKRFQSLTRGHAVIMGRKTWSEDLEKCPLQQRRNIVITQHPEHYQVADRCRDYPLGLRFVPSLWAALREVEDEDKVFIVGGASIYAQALPLADVLDLTLVEGDYDGDVYFPKYEHLLGSEFEQVTVEHHPGFRFETYRRISIFTGLPMRYGAQVMSLVPADRAQPYRPILKPKI